MSGGRLYLYLFTLLIAPWALGADDFADDSAEMKQSSLIENCSKYSASGSVTACVANAREILSDGLVRGILGNTASNNVTASMDVMTALFKELMREKALQFQTAHMIARDYMDLGNDFGSDEVLDRHRQGLAPNSMHLGASAKGFNSPGQCLERFPKVAQMKKEAVKSLFFESGQAVREKNQRVAASFNNFFAGGESVADPRCSGQLVCKSVIERAALADKYSTQLDKMKESPDLAPNDSSFNDWVMRKLPDKVLRSDYQKTAMAEVDYSLSEVLTTDPALWEPVGPGCDNAIDPRTGKLKSGCRHAYQAIASLNREYDKQLVDPSTKPDNERAFWVKNNAEWRAKRDSQLKEIYQEANRRTKKGVLDAVNSTCGKDFNAGWLVMSDEIARSVMNENPGFEGVYCGLLKKQLKEKDWLEIKHTALYWTTMGAAAVGVVAGIVATKASAGTATAATAPLISVSLGVLSGGASSTRYYSELQEARQNRLVAEANFGANIGDPRVLAEAKAKEKQLEADFKTEIAVTAATLGLDMGLAEISLLKNAKTVADRHAAWMQLMRNQAKRRSALRNGRSVWDASTEGAEVTRAMNAAYKSGVVLDETKAAGGFEKYNPRGDAYSAAKITVGGKRVPAIDHIRKLTKDLYGVKIVEGSEAVAYLEKGGGAWGKYAFNETPPTLYIHPKATIDTLWHELDHVKQFSGRYGKVKRGADGQPVFKNSMSKYLHEMDYADSQKVLRKGSNGQVIEKKIVTTTEIIELDVELKQYSAMNRGVASGRVRPEAVAGIGDRMAERYTRMKQSLPDLKASTVAHKKHLDEMTRQREAVENLIKSEADPAVATIFKQDLEKFTAAEALAKKNYRRVNAATNAFEEVISRTEKLAKKDPSIANKINSYKATRQLAAAETPLKVAKVFTSDEVEYLMQALDAEN